MSSSSLHVPVHLNGLTPREGVMDTVYRFVQGIDDADPSLVESTLTADATTDLTDLQKLKEHYAMVSGRENIVGGLVNSIGRLDTTHHISNFRVHIDGDGRRAKMTAYAIAQHWKQGEGCDEAKGAGDCFLMGNRLQGTLVRGEEPGDDGLWRFVDFKLTPSWYYGDKSFM